MDIVMSFRHIHTKEPFKSIIKNYAEDKTQRLKKYFNGKIQVKWTFEYENQNSIAHCHLVGNRMNYFGEAATEDLHSAIDSAVDKIERQVKKKKEILRDHHHKRNRASIKKAA